MKLVDIGDGSTYLNMDYIIIVFSIGENDYRIRTINDGYYKISKEARDIILTYGKAN